MRSWSSVAALVLVAALVGCAPAQVEVVVPGPAASGDAGGEASAAAEPAAVFVSVIDGDTVETSEGTVRIIGIDTPERGECGHAEASAVIGNVLAAGDPVTLELPPGQNDQDRHGRLLRYVITSDGVDIGMLQLQSGHAVARYDSRDGYPAHPREADYRAAQLATLSLDRAVITVACQGEASVPLAPTTDGWWDQYPSCAQLKRNTVGHPIGPFDRDDPAQAAAYDWFANRTGNNGDGDGDGLACE